MANLGIDITPFLPPVPGEGAGADELRRSLAQLIEGLTEYSEKLQTESHLFNRVSDGSNSLEALIAGGILTITGSGATNVIVSANGADVNSVGGGGSATVDFKVPLVRGVTFTWNGTYPRLEWTVDADAAILYDGAEYPVNAGNGLTGATYKYAYIDMSELLGAADPDQIIKVTNNPSIPSALTNTYDRWYIVIVDGAVFVTLQSPIIMGGLIQSDTIVARQVHATDLFTKFFTISSGGAIHSAGNAAYGGTDAGFWLGDDSGTYKFEIYTDADNYFRYDGTNLTMRTESGFFGNTATSYVDFAELVVTGYPEIKLYDASPLSHLKLNPWLMQLYTTDYTSYYDMAVFAANANGPELYLRKSRNTALTPGAAIQDGDKLGSIKFQYDNGSAFTGSTQIYAVRNGASVGDIDLWLNANQELILNAGDRIVCTDPFKIGATSAPASPENGDIYYDLVNHQFKGRADSAWDILNNNAITQIKLGTFTTDAGSPGTTKSITGVGFQPDILLIYHMVDGMASYIKTTEDSGYYSCTITNGNYDQDDIRTLDTDGFTIGTGLNRFDDDYGYIAIKIT